MVHIHNGILLAIKKNAFDPVLMKWMKLEPIIQSEVSQKEKHQYRILMHVYMEFRKMVMTTIYTRQQKRHRYKEQTVVLCGRRRGRDDLVEQHWNMYIKVCEIDDQSKFNAWNRALKAGALGQPRGMGWEGRWDWGLGQGGHMYTGGWFMSMIAKQPQYYKVISLQLK